MFFNSKLLLICALFGATFSSGNDKLNDIEEEEQQNKDSAKYNETSALNWIIDLCSNHDQLQKNHLDSCLKWSTGLEHETFLVHRKDGHLDEYVVNVGSVVLQMARYGRAFKLDKQTQSVALYLQNTGVEFSGRECAGINEINFKAMAESVSLKHKQLTFDSAFCQIETLDNKIIDVLSTYPGEASISEKIGDIQHPRSGASSTLGLYTRTGGKTHVCSTCDGDCHLKDYTGSYHISVSLPYDSDGWVAYNESIINRSDGYNSSDPYSYLMCSNSYNRYNRSDNYNSSETPRDVWVKAHVNLSNMIQWVEPLIIAVFGSADPESVCDDGKFVEGSYRTMNAGWGVPGTTDVRTFGEVGTGRYSDVGFDWLLDVAPESSVGIFGCVEKGMGSDIRTKSDTDEHEMRPEDTIEAMNVGQGIEVRFLDNFPLEHLKTAYHVIALLAEVSRTHVSEKYVYDHAGWKKSAQQSVLNGWNAILHSEYISSLEEVLDVDLSELNGNKQAFEVFNELYTQLHLKHSEGFWTNLLLEDVSMQKVGNPNRNSWELDSKRIGLTPPVLREIFGLDGKSSTVVYMNDLNLNRCMDDAEDLVYLAESLGMVESIEKNTDGTVNSAKFLPKGKKEDLSVLSCDA